MNALHTHVGLSLRDHLEPTIVAARERGLLDCVEANISPTIAAGARTLLRRQLARVDVAYSFHLTDSSVCSADFPDNNHCRAAAEFIADFSPISISDHFTACRVGDLDLDMNLPIFADEQALAVYAENVALWQQAFAATGATTALEHVPGGFELAASTMTQGQAYAQVMHRTGVGVLLDLHNAYCDERSFGGRAEAFIAALPLDAVVEIHLAGGHLLPAGTYFDGHSRDLPERVFELLAWVLKQVRPKLIILEREHDFVGLDRILRDLERVRELVARC